MIEDLNGQPTILGKYELLEQIGEGGMGEVYRARHTLLGSEAAVKLLRQRHSQEKEVVERFFNEARATTAIRHPGIVSVYDFGFAPDGRAYIVMELLAGHSIGDRVRDHGPADEISILRTMRQATGVLDAAHGAGIIHRDLKPDNLFVVEDPEVEGGERIRVLDFGIAKLSGPIAENVSKTATGVILGSPLYMSPEQCEGPGKTTHRSDIYSLGCVMYEMATGRPPFSARGVGAILAKHIYEPPTEPTVLRPSLSRELNSLILSMLEKDPNNRPQTMAEVADKIDRIIESTGLDTLPRTRRSAQLANPPKRPISDAKIAARMAPTMASVQQTTHGASSGQISVEPPASRGRGGLIAASSIVLVGAIGTIVFMATRTDSSSPATQPVAAATDAAAAVEEKPDTTAPPPVETVTLKITSAPAGALVRDSARELLGETPFEVLTDKGAAAQRFIITRDGFDEVELSLEPDRDRTEHVEMVAVAQVKPEKKKKKKKTSTTKKKKKKTGFGETIDPLEE